MKDKQLNPRTVPISRLSLAQKMVLLRRQQRRQTLRRLRRMGISVGTLRRPCSGCGLVHSALAERVSNTALRPRSAERKSRHE